MAAKKDTEVQVLQVEQGQITAYVLGTSPLIMNRLSEKVKRELLLPKGRKNAAEKASSLKHNPLEEYRASVHRSHDPKSPTLLVMPAVVFKGSMRTAALDMPGQSKAQIGRLVWVQGQTVDVYGVPQLFMAPVRSADINKTPDIRTRAILPAWCAKVTINFVQPIIRAQSVINLLAAGGLYIGVGDWRAEKGSGNYGAFKLTAEQDPHVKQLMKSGGRKAQENALAHPECYDEESQELLDWYSEEVQRRGFKEAA